jgi:hypothetical protein
MLSAPYLPDSAGPYSFLAGYIEGAGTQEIVNRSVLTSQAA